MLILALDTTTRAGSYALWRDGAVLEERAGSPELTHAERLPGDLADLLGAHGLHPADVDLYAVASGPGSFTGLRVGIATLQALALVHGRQLVGVTALEALAQCGARIATAPTPSSSVVIGAWMEAYRGEVFGALYRVGEARGPLFQLEELAGPSVGAPAAVATAWATQLTGEAPLLTIIGDGVPSSESVLQATWPQARLLDAVPLAATIARIAAAAPERAAAPHAIVPLYVRRPDAELARDRQRAATPAASCAPDAS